MKEYNSEIKNAYKIVNPTKKENLFFELCKKIAMYKNEFIVSIKTQTKAMHIYHTVSKKQLLKIINKM